METPVPSPDMVTASREHLNSQYTRGAERLLWDLDQQPMRCEPELAVADRAEPGTQADHAAERATLG